MIDLYKERVNAVIDRHIESDVEEQVYGFSRNGINIIAFNLVWAVAVGCGLSLFVGSIDATLWLDPMLQTVVA